jgi:hypothetical protein
MATPSEETQCLEFANLFSKRDFDTDVQRHQSARATGAHARKPHGRRIATDIDELDVATVCLEEWANASKDQFDLLSCDHSKLPPVR